jgi:hypothetical protein
MRRSNVHADRSKSMNHSAHDYLQEVKLEMDSGYTLDCVAHACALARLLLDDGRTPWIGRLRETIQRDDYIFHAPLTPIRSMGNARPTWTTHYVCCAGDEVYDPIAGKPLAIADYAQIIFGRVIPVVEHFSPEVTADLLQRDELRRAFRPGLVRDLEPRA